MGAPRFKGGLKTPGVNIAPWNQSPYLFSTKNDEIYVNNQKLICYHFSGFRLLGKNEFAIAWEFETSPIPIVYKPYLSALKQVVERIEKVSPEFTGYFIEEKRKQNARTYKYDNFMQINTP